MKKTLFILVLTFFSFQLFSQTTFYVSNTGSNLNSGLSQSQPFQTLDHAFSEIANIAAPTMGTDIILYIMPGDYFLSSGIDFPPNFRGYNNHRIIITNFNNQPVNLIGGTAFSSWTPYQGSIYRCHMVVSRADIVIENLIQSTNKYDSIDELLNGPSPGGFFYDTKDNHLYYYPHNNGINSQSISIPQAFYFFKIGSSTDSLSNITIRGINFIGTAPFSDNSIDNEDYGMIILENVENVEISGCRFIGSGSNGILAKASVQGLNIRNNRIDQVQANGVFLQGFDIGAGGFATPADSYVSRDNNIVNNFITSFGRDGQGKGISIYQSGENTVSDNTINNGSGAGIYIVGDKSAYNTKRNKSVYATVLNDSNYFSYLNSRNNIVSRNRIYQTARNYSGAIFLNFAGTGNVVEFNRISEIEKSDVNRSGIFLGEWINGAIIRHNIIHDINDSDHNSAGMIISAQNIRVFNNILALNDGAQDFWLSEMDNPVNNLEIQNNLIYTLSGKYIYSIDFAVSMLNSSIDNNFIYHNGEYNIQSFFNDLTFAEWKSQYLYDKNSLIQKSPLFEELSTGNFEVSSNSPALKTKFVNIDQNNAGVNLNYPLYFAKDKLEAERADGAKSSNLITNATSLLSKSSSDYFSFSRVQLESHLKNIELRYSNASDATESRMLEIRDGGLSGKLLATLDLPGTGGIDNFRVVDMAITLDQKVTALYFVLRGSNSHVKIDWISFYEIDSSVQTNKDNQPPIVEFLKPSDGDYIKKYKKIAILCKASDLDGSINNIILKIDGEAKHESKDNEFTYDWENPTPGEHELTLTASDDKGAVTSKTIKIEVSDEDFKLIQIIEPKSNSFFPSPATIQIKAESIGPSVNISKIDILLNGGPIQSFFNQDSISMEFKTNDLNGQLLFSAVATDDNGNSSEDSVNIMVGSERNLLLHWPMDDIVGDETKDFSSSDPKHDGLVTGGQITRGAIGSAIMIDGLGRVQTKTHVFESLGNFTVAGWIKPRTLRGGQYLFGQPNLIDIHFKSESTLEIKTPDRTMSLIYEYKPDEWHHLAVVGNNSSLSFYIDGNLVKFSESNRNQNLNSGYTLFLAGGYYGSRDPGNSNYEGAFDDIRVYDTCLNEWELKAISRLGDNLRPDVSILSPEDGAHFISPHEITIKVFADDTDGEVKNVQFYIDDDLVFTDDESEYYYNWTNITPGVHMLKAIATDDRGLESQDSITISVSATSDQLIAHWSFDEGSGDYVHDSSGNNNSGTNFGADYKPGVTGTALNFSGKEYVKTKQGIMNGLKSFTILGWINPQDNSNTSGLWGQNGIAMVSLDASNIIKLDTNGSNSISASYPWPNNGWHHVTVVGTGDDLYLFLDGKLVMNGGNRSENYGINKMPFNIGGNVLDLTGDNFTGLIDELYVYGRALTTEEIKKHLFSVDKILPEIKILSPSSGSRYNNTGGAILFQIVVKGNGAIVSKVELYANDSLVGTAESEPYNIIWEKYAAENYTIRARAVTDQEMWAEDKIYISIFDPNADTDHGPQASAENENSKDLSSQDKNKSSTKSKTLLITVEQKEAAGIENMEQPGSTPIPLIFLRENTPIPGRFLVDENDLSDEVENQYNKLIADNIALDKLAIVNDDKTGRFIDSNQQKQLVSQKNGNPDSQSTFPWFWLVPAVVLIIAAVFLVIKSINQKNDAP
ncbi:MAG: carbohydrate-binding protein [Spirochaetales bacterium]|nr:carbohydrate-binding protein [Spirochaetales bacterium]